MSKSLFILFLFIFPLTVSAQPPLNDNCTNAQGITVPGSGNICVTSSNATATSDLTLDACDTGAAGIEVWYTFIATGSLNTVALSPSGSPAVTFAVVTLSTFGCASGSYSACAASSTSGGTATTTLSTALGQQVWVSVETNGANGGFQLCVTSLTPAPSPGQACATATVICDKSPISVASMSPVNPSGLFPSCFSSAGQNDVFYQFTVSQSGTLEWNCDPTDNVKAEFDWAVYNITAGCTGTEVACNYNFSGAMGSPIGMQAGAATCGSFPFGPTTEFCPPLNVTAGQTYAIMIDNYGDGTGGTGGFNLTWGGTFQIGPTAAFSVAPSSACNSLTTTITNTSIGATTYKWKWGDGDSSTATNPGSHTYSAPGTYLISLNVSTAAGCTDVTSAVINVFPNPTGTTSTTGTSCGLNNGTATVVPAGGNSPFTYSWSSGGQTTSTATGLAVGSYTVTITTANGCVGTASATVTAGPALTSTSTSTNVNCNGSCTGGSVTASAAGGLTNYSYSWSGGLGTGASKTNVCAGTYTVTVTDANGCTSTSTATVNQPALLGVSTACTDVSVPAAGDGSTTANPIGGTTSYSYLWNTGATTKSLTGLPGGTYCVTVTDNNGCTTTTCCSVNEPTCVLAVPTSTKTDVSCNGLQDGVITASISGGTTPYTYTWTSNVSTTNVASSLSAGSYTVTITDATGCTRMITTSIAAPSALLSSASSANALCNGVCNGTLTASASGGASGYTYNWSGGIGTGANKTAVCAGTYTVTVTDANGCTKTSTAITGQPTAVSVTASSITTKCNASCDGTVTANASGGTSGYSYIWNSLGSGDTKTGVCPGTYTVTASDANGCTITSSTTVNTPSVVTATASSTNISCSGTCDGTLSTSASGGNSGYTYTWSGGLGTGSNKTAVCAGTYSVTISDINNCSTVSSATVNPYVAMTIAPSSSNVTCGGQANGVAVAPVSGGTSPYQYTWSPNVSVSDSAKNLSAGNYSVTVSDASNCTATQAYTITQPVVLSATNSKTDVSCFGGNNGTAAVAVTGGTSPYSYSWSLNASTASSATGLIKGNYSITISDMNGCTNVQNIFVDQPVILQSSSVQTNVSCAGGNNGTATVTATGGVTPYTYSWTSAVSTTSSATGLLAGNYTITVTDVNNCTTTTFSTLTEPTDIVLNISNTENVKCFGNCNGKATVSGSGGVTPYSYLWNNTPPSVAATATNLCIGAFTVTVTDTNGCTDTVSAIINQPSQLVVADTAINAKCTGVCDGLIVIIPQGGTPFSSGSPYTVVWTPNVSGQGTTANSLCAGNYSVLVTDSNGCSISKTFSINSPVSMNTSVFADSANCDKPDGTASVTASGGTSPYSYLWNDSIATVADTAKNLKPGIYIVIVTDTNGCNTSDTVTVGNKLPPTVSVTATDVKCNGDCDGGTSALGSGGTTSTYTYLWNNNGSTQFMTGLCAGIYTVTISDGNNCTAVTADTVFQPLPVSVKAIGDTTVCIGGAAVISAVALGGNGSPYSYSWSNDDSSASTQTIPLTNPSCYYVTVFDTLGCVSAPDTQCVTLYTPIQAMASTDTTICKGGTVQLSVNSSGGISAPYSIIWKDDVGNTVGTGSSIIVSPIGINPSMVSYMVIVDDGCETPNDMDTVVVSFHPDLKDDFTASSTMGCEPLTINFVDTSVTLVNCTWNFGEGQPLSGCDGVSYTYQSAGTYSVSLYLASSFGCRDTVKKLSYIIVNPLPDAGFIANPMESTVQDMNIAFTDSSSPTVSQWKWFFYDNDNTTVLGTDSVMNPKFNFTSMNSDPLAQLNDTGYYPVKLTVTTSAGCKDSIIKRVYFDGIYFVQIPNAFTPDGDGINDYFFPIGMGIKPEENYKLYIFNRWGDLIFQSSRLNDHWDGTSKELSGSKVPEGVYVWKLELQDATKASDRHKYMGHVTVLYR